MGTLIPGAAIIYTRNGTTVYGQYRDPPHNQRPPWIVGDTKGTMVDRLPDKEWMDIQRIAEKNPILKSQLDKLMILYYTIKDSSEED